VARGLFLPPAAADTLMRMTARSDLRTLTLLAVVALAASACASATREIRVLPPRPVASPEATATAEPASAPAASTGAPDIVPLGLAVARTAGALLGLPYREGGALPDGFDCSGFVNYVFARHGIAVPRDVRRQALAGAPVDPGAIVAGDLVFFSTTGSGATHVGIAIGEGRFIHAPKSGDVVRVESMASAYWNARFVAARRIPVP
jgi:cell wall-associated NlpC family hydrolase